MNLFTKFVLSHPDSVWVAHNGSRFDTVFLLRQLLVEEDIVPDVIMTGNKIISLKISHVNVSFMDSFLFLDMRLAQFPKALGFSDLTKGYHPYYFYDLEYEGPMIDKKYFDMEKIENDEIEKQKFNKWYDKKCKNDYVFANEMYYYCSMDVNILRKGCIIFAYLMKDVGSVLPFYDRSCITIAGLALKVFKINFLQKNQLTLIPELGYRGNVNQSLIALCWLNEINEKSPIEYRLSTNGEKKS